MKAHIFRFALLLPFVFCFQITRAEPITYFLPQQNYDKSIPTPEQFLGYQLGDWHVPYDQVQEYLKLLAQKSDRVQFQINGRTWEQRNQVMLVITSTENQNHIESIKKDREQLILRPDSPLVVWLGYSIHGNEASGTNAALAVAYYLTASQDQEVKTLLKNTVVLLDPSFNPDGYSRFSSWVNANKSLLPNGDPADREFHEPWPGGRTNHYWFDLNRDWLLTVNPESRNRLKIFHQWHPNVLTDHHEMGSNSTYFFQPGVHSRQNPLTPEKNFTLTKQLAQFHARALDAIGSQYYSEEGFDDFYPGKGSTYPDLNGSIGILFEQASARGHYQQTINGPLSFAFAIRNHVTTSLSTLEGSLKIKKSLQAYQAEFFNSKNSGKVKGYEFSSSDDPTRAEELAKVFVRHHIEIYRNKNGHGFVVPLNQKHGTLARVLFDVRTQFKNNTFYDVSAWAMQYAYHVKLTEINSQSKVKNMLGAKYTGASQSKKSIKFKDDIVAVAIPWGQQNSARLSAFLMSQKIRLTVNVKPLTVTSNGQNNSLRAGHVLLYLNNQKKSHKKIIELISQFQKKFPLKMIAISSGLSPRGIDLGSPSFRHLKLPRIALVIQDSLNPYEAGEVKYTVEQKIGMPLTTLPINQVSPESLHKYSHLILVNSRNNKGWNDLFKKNINTWIEQGGVAIGFKKSAQWLGKIKGIDFEIFDSLKDKQKPERLDFAKKPDYQAEDVIGGAIFETDVDNTSPLGFGIPERQLAVFKNSRLIFSKPDSPFATIAQYTGKPLLSGYASKYNQDKIANSPMMVSLPYKKGKLILFADDPNFRGYWLGSMTLFYNSLFMSNL